MNNFFLELTMDTRRLYRFSAYCILAGVLFSFSSFYFLDYSLAYFFSQPEHYLYWKIAREITNVGLGEYYFASIFILLLYVYVAKPKSSVWLRPWLWQSLGALLGSGVILRLLKWGLGRKRPHVEPRLAENVFEPLSWHWDFQSLPSGHTQVLFSVAVMLSILKPKWSGWWLALATVFSFTRVMTYDHFLSDVIIGAVVGVVGSLFSLQVLMRLRGGAEL